MNSKDEKLIWEAYEHIADWTGKDAPASKEPFKTLDDLIVRSMEHVKSQYPDGTGNTAEVIAAAVLKQSPELRNTYDQESVKDRVKFHLKGLGIEESSEQEKKKDKDKKEDKKVKSKRPKIVDTGGRPYGPLSDSVQN